MKKIKIHCDRCKSMIGGMVSENVTAGYYNVSYGYWNKFAKEGEIHLCDVCMWQDENYIQIYGKVLGNNGIFIYNN